MSTRSLLWSLYGLVTSLAAVLLAFSGLRANPVAWVVYSFASAAGAIVLSWLFRPQRG